MTLHLFFSVGFLTGYAMTAVVVMGLGFAYDYGSDAQRAAVKDWEY